MPTHREPVVAHDRSGISLLPATAPALPHNRANRQTTTTYFPSGDIKTRLSPSGVRDRYFLNFDGTTNRMIEKVQDGDDKELKDQTYLYDLNMNRTQDERGTYAFNARDQITKWTRDKLKGLSARRR